jgi:predicted DNA-binding protein
MPAKNVKQVACYLTKEQIQALDKLAAKMAVPNKASLIRRAVEEFLARQSKKG